MPNYNVPNQLNLQSNGQPQFPTQFPFGNANVLLNNTPYDNYMGRVNSPQNQYLKCRPVSSKDEARAFQIDLDGSLWVFTDVGNGKIYTKQVNNDGTAAFKTYIITEESDNPYTTSSQYVTKEEFNKVIKELMVAIHPAQESTSTRNNNTETLINF